MPQQSIKHLSYRHQLFFSFLPIQQKQNNILRNGGGLLKEEDEDEVATKLQAAFKAMQVYTMVFDKCHFPVYKDLYLLRRK